MRRQSTPENIELINNTVLYYMRDAADKDLKQQYITMIRMLVQKVVVGPTPGHPRPHRLDPGCDGGEDDP